MVASRIARPNDAMGSDTPRKSRGSRPRRSVDLGSATRRPTSLPPSSGLYVGHVRHERTTAPRHGFRYEVWLTLLDIDAIDALAGRLRLFGHNRLRPMSFHDDDHLEPRGGPLREKLARLFERHGESPPAGRVLLLTHCRVLGYAFNPVSFFYCYDAEHTLTHVVAEVNNTFGDRLPYLLQVRDGGTYWREKKRMHVSPFFSLDGSYDFVLPAPNDRIETTVTLTQGGRAVLVAHMGLQRRPLTDWEIARTLCASPFMTIKVIAAIHWQALRLWRKGARFRHQPRFDPESARRRPA